MTPSLVRIQPRLADRAELVVRKQYTIDAGQKDSVRIVQIANATRTVLVVDDEDGVLHAIRQTLQGLDYRMIATTDARHALGIVKSDSSIDLLITDLFMPGMDGATLLRKSREIRPNLRVVLTTGVASNDQVRQWRARGELIVEKPWRDEEFIQAMRKVFNRSER